MQASEIAEVVREAELEDKYELAALRDTDLEKNLIKISEHYCNTKTSYVTKCEAAAKQLLMTILTDSELKEIHSARYRTKTLDSLLTKYIKKKALLPETPGTDYNIEKYRPLNKSNYYKIMFDKSRGKAGKTEKIDCPIKVDGDLEQKKYESLQKRIANINNFQKQVKAFDGAVDNLFD